MKNPEGGLDTWNQQRTNAELGAFVARLQGKIELNDKDT